jgi:hypothetical protein
MRLWETGSNSANNEEQLAGREQDAWHREKMVASQCIADVEFPSPGNISNLTIYA